MNDAKKYVSEHLTQRAVLEGLAEECCELAQAALKLIRATDGENPTPVSEEECGCFEDIAGAYYTKPVAWAYSNGIVSGVSATRFDPNRIVTRQEAIAIFYRYCVGQNGVNAQSGMELDSFADQADVAGYAQNAFTWAVATGLVVGSEGAGGVYLNPTTSLNRASAAVLLQRCVEDIM